MAIAIKSIPTLKDKVAKDFVKNANEATRNRASIDFSKQIQTARSILDKAKIKQS
ncbi:MAG: hypothetical protein WD048_00260 [Chitinophagales bacterium]